MSSQPPSPRTIVPLLILLFILGFFFIPALASPLANPNFIASNGEEIVTTENSFIQPPQPAGANVLEGNDVVEEGQPIGSLHTHDDHYPPEALVRLKNNYLDAREGQEYDLTCIKAHYCAILLQNASPATIHELANLATHQKGKALNLVLDYTERDIKDAGAPFTHTNDRMRDDIPLSELQTTTLEEQTTRERRCHRAIRSDAEELVSG
ncbi:uncharacterized protein KY384_003959 [Bacidia gigantensis]|uniref:uncharacterized protein n=1 Tax=Bacidia gigantensis TaxID=2732470 RepID=UPI001D039E50|nr:uncharacterized protein KY384_003959 [Bacidia gigantensis]KAG8532318.1 hypothetical protein KY384_003959 [Bacidia gigantensis]